MIFQVKFANHSGKQSLFDWELVDLRHARAWRQVMENWKGQFTAAGPSWNDKWFIAGSEAALEEKLLQMKAKVQRIDQLGRHYVGSEKIDKNISTAELNRIHQEFHRFVEERPAPSPDHPDHETYTLCHDLNHMVHHVEHARKFTEDAVLCRKLIATGNPHFQLPYEESDYGHYTTSMCKGWLYLGYATPGKNLYQCHADNDMDVVRKRLVRQSQGIANEIHLEFDGSPEVDPGLHASLTEKYRNWCEQNRVQDFGYDIKLPVYNPGRIPLARPQSDIHGLLSFFEERPGQILDFNFI